MLKNDKELITRWDRKRELFLRRCDRHSSTASSGGLNDPKWSRFQVAHMRVWDGQRMHESHAECIRLHRSAITKGHAKLRQRVLWVLQCRGRMMPVQCRCGCCVITQHYLWCEQADENESSHLDAHSKNWPLSACTLSSPEMSSIIQLNAQFCKHSVGTYTQLPTH